MALHKLTNWEVNGPQDSDFMESYWNDETKQVEFHEVGSTRHAGGSSCSNTPPINDIDMLVEAIAWLGDFIFGQIRAAEHRDVLEPQAVGRGDMVRLLRDVKHHKVLYPAGTVGEVCLDWLLGQFYRKGYNRPGRGNTRVAIRISKEPGADWLYFALYALRHEREPMSDEQLQERANILAQNCQFSAAHPRNTWDTKNYALLLLERIQKEQVAA